MGKKSSNAMNLAALLKHYGSVNEIEAAFDAELARNLQEAGDIDSFRPLQAATKGSSILALAAKTTQRNQDPFRLVSIEAHLQFADGRSLEILIDEKGLYYLSREEAAGMTAFAVGEFRFRLEHNSTSNYSLICDSAEFERALEGLDANGRLAAS